MATPITKTRTNYIHITDYDRFKSILEQTNVTNGCSIEIISNKSDNETLYGFYAEDEILGFPVPDINSADDEYDESECDYEYDHSSFIDALKTVIAPGDALIITTISMEKMRYLDAETEIITCNDYKYIGLADIAVAEAAKMLNNPDWQTRNTY